MREIDVERAHGLIAYNINEHIFSFGRGTDPFVFEGVTDKHIQWFRGT